MLRVHNAQGMASKQLVPLQLRLLSCSDTCDTLARCRMAIEGHLYSQGLASDVHISVLRSFIDEASLQIA